MMGMIVAPGEFPSIAFYEKRSKADAMPAYHYAPVWPTTIFQCAYRGTSALSVSYQYSVSQVRKPFAVRGLYQLTALEYTE
jgi:hypothetical protein